MVSLLMALRVSIALLMIDSIIEISFISSMVSWLHRRAGKDFFINYDKVVFPLHGKPQFLLLNQGHTSNGAAGTAFVLIGLGGFLALWMRGSTKSRNSSLSTFIHQSWLVLNVLATLLTFSALAYTMVLTRLHRGQTIDVAVALRLNNHPYPNYVAYPLDEWTPQNWFSAMLNLSFASNEARSDVQTHLRIMEAWQYNLVPMFIIQLVTCSLAFVESLAWRRYSSIDQSDQSESVTKHLEA